jgi:predicted nuclease of predicted toxin-antitoxin system
MIRLLLDQGLPRGTVLHLRREGWDVVHVGEIGMSRATDQEILDYARYENRVCVTLDADFHALLVLGSEQSPSVVRIRIEGLQAIAMAELLIRIKPHIQSAAEQGALITVTEAQVRIRRLPVNAGAAGEKALRSR